MNLTHLYACLLKLDSSITDGTTSSSISTLLNIDEPQDKKKYIHNIRRIVTKLAECTLNSTDAFFNADIANKFYSPLEFGNIIGITKDAVMKNINSGNLKCTQNGKGANIYISTENGDDFVSKRAKYKMPWDNRMFNLLS